MKRTGICLASVLLAVNGAVSAQELTLTTADWDWLYSAGPVFQSLMPRNENDRTALVTFRSFPDAGYDDREAYFQVREVHEGVPRATLTAAVVMPLGKSLREQLLALHLNNPAASPQDLAGQLSVFKGNVTELNCPELRVRMTHLAKVRIHTPSFDELAVHPLVRVIEIRSGMGNIYAELYDDNDPMVKWAEATLELLKRCADSAAKERQP